MTVSIQVSTRVTSIWQERSPGNSRHTTDANALKETLENSLYRLKCRLDSLLRIAAMLILAELSCTLSCLDDVGLRARLTDGGGGGGGFFKLDGGTKTK